MGDRLARTDGGGARGRGRTAGSAGWVTALTRAGVVLAGSYVGLLLLPDRLVVYLSTRVGPDVRDTIVLLWVILVFGLLSWGLVALQRGRRRTR